MCRPSNIDGRCEIRLLYLVKILILQLHANYAEGLHFSAFIINGDIAFKLVFNSSIHHLAVLMLRNYLPISVMASCDVQEASVSELHIVRYVDDQVVPPDGARHFSS